MAYMLNWLSFKCCINTGYYTHRQLLEVRSRPNLLPMQCYMQEWTPNRF